MPDLNSTDRFEFTEAQLTVYAAFDSTDRRPLKDFRTRMRAFNQLKRLNIVSVIDGTAHLNRDLVSELFNGKA